MSNPKRTKTGGRTKDSGLYPLRFSARCNKELFDILTKTASKYKDKKRDTK